MKRIDKNNLNLVFDISKRVIVLTIKEMQLQNNSTNYIRKIFNNLNYVVKNLNCYDALVNNITDIIVEELHMYSMCIEDINNNFRVKRNIKCRKHIRNYIKNNLTVIETITHPISYMFNRNKGYSTFFDFLNKRIEKEICDKDINLFIYEALKYYESYDPWLSI